MPQQAPRAAPGWLQAACSRRQRLVPLRGNGPPAPAVLGGPALFRLCRQTWKAAGSLPLSRAKGNLTCRSLRIPLPSAQDEACSSAAPSREFRRKLLTLPSPPAHRCQAHAPRRREARLKVLIRLLRWLLWGGEGGWERGEAQAGRALLCRAEMCSLSRGALLLRGKGTARATQGLGSAFVFQPGTGAARGRPGEPPASLGA